MSMEFISFICVYIVCFVDGEGLSTRYFQCTIITTHSVSSEVLGSPPLLEQDTLSKL